MCESSELTFYIYHRFCVIEGEEVTDFFIQSTMLSQSTLQGRRVPRYLHLSYLNKNVATGDSRAIDKLSLSCNARLRRL